jgi:hypothetical protein
MHDEIEQRVDYNTIFSPKQAGLGRPYSEMLAHEEKGMVKYRRCWENACGSSGSFENYSYLLIWFMLFFFFFYPIMSQADYIAPCSLLLCSLIFVFT